MSVTSKPKSAPTPKPASPFIPVIIIGGLIFLIFLFSRFTQTKPDPALLSQPAPAATNSADFNQQNRLEATGASIVEPNLSADNPSSDSTQVVLYGRNTCPHCQVVAAFLDQQPQIKARVPKKWLDDGQNDRNEQKEIVAAAKDCQIPENSLGVPLLHLTGTNAPTNPQERCLMGDTPIIEYLTKNFN